MKLLAKIRSKARLRERDPEAVVYHQHDFLPGNDVASKLPENVRERILTAIFAFVSPHSQDEAYTSFENSMLEDGCMLCDTRDLANCSLVCRSWSKPAQALLCVISF